jgi:hypothetical protein
MRHTRYFNSLAPLAALGAGSLAGYYLVVRPWNQWNETQPRRRGGVGAQGVSTTSAEDGTSTVRTTGPSSESTWKWPHTRV